MIIAVYYQTFGIRFAHYINISFLVQYSNSKEVHCFVYWSFQRGNIYIA
jgi:hypothetical protein